MVADLTKRSLDVLRERGWLVDRVERQTGPVKRDWCGFADLLAFSEEGSAMAIQVTSASNASSHRKKIKDNVHAHTFSANNGLVVLHLWKKVKGKWALYREEEITF